MTSLSCAPGPGTDMLVPASLKFGHVNECRWTTQVADFNVRERIFDRILSDANRGEEAEQVRHLRNLDY